MLTILLIALGVFALGTLATMLAAYTESRLDWPYSEPKPPRPDDTLDPYTLRQLTGARGLQFRILGWSNDIKGPQYKIDYLFLVAPGADTLAIVGVGKLFGMSLKGIWLISIGENDTGFISVNSPSCSEVDVTGRWKDQLVLDADFADLYNSHCAWLNKMGVLLLPFSPGAELDLYRQAKQRRVELLIQAGVARRVGPDPTRWKYTFAGAVRRGFWGNMLTMGRSLKVTKSH